MLSLPGNGRSVRKTGCALGLAPWQHRAAGTGKRWLLRAELLPYKRSHSSFTGALKISGNQRLPQNSICANQASQLSEVPRLKLFWSKEKTSLLSGLLSAVAVSGGMVQGRQVVWGTWWARGVQPSLWGRQQPAAPPRFALWLHIVFEHWLWWVTECPQTVSEVNISHSCPQNLFLLLLCTAFDLCALLGTSDGIRSAKQEFSYRYMVCSVSSEFPWKYKDQQQDWIQIHFLACFQRWCQCLWGSWLPDPTP